MINQRIEVTKTINDELYTTERDIEVPGNFQEMVDTLGEAEVYNLAKDRLVDKARYELTQELVAAVDPKKAPKKTQAKKITLG